ncbi:uncharacterized protein LOC119648123 [Hermetia illucens]|uniref:uncharacterized protein LOC119648123 n=1 Tax=Hermetia illucens TaxID=343691 RepID=UPI0018CC2B4F|nr:uncharacterized protein LOC119648123 [Hermetia illucens]
MAARFHSSCLVLLIFISVLALSQAGRHQAGRYQAGRSRYSVCPKWETKGTVLLPHRDCRKFYICDRGQRVQMECKRGLHFNPRYQVCDYPSQAGCVQKYRKYARRLICK